MTINDFKTVNCPKCAGKGKISAYTYNKGGLCFCCNGSGTKSIPFTRPMTDEEVVAKLAELGFPIMERETTKPSTGCWFFDMFPSEEEVAATAESMIGARLMLAAMI